MIDISFAILTPETILALDVIEPVYAVTSFSSTNELIFFYQHQVILRLY